MTINPRSTALLVMDYQNGFLPTVPEPVQLVRRVRTVIDATRSAGGTIAYVRLAFTDPDYEQVPALNKAFGPVAEKRLLHASTDETAVLDELSPAEGDIIVRKTRVGAFSTTNLDKQLRDRGIATLVLTGIHTSGVVLSTLREAADGDYKLYVLADATADPDAETHAILHSRVFPQQADVLSTEEYLSLIRS
jgi:nicotinamidase-related amidase